MSSTEDERESDRENGWKDKLKKTRRGFHKESPPTRKRKVIKQSWELKDVYEPEYIDDSDPDMVKAKPRDEVVVKEKKAESDPTKKRKEERLKRRYAMLDEMRKKEEAKGGRKSKRCRRARVLAR